MRSAAFRHHRVPEARGCGHGEVEPRPGPLGNQAPVQELPGHRAHPLVHHQLRHDGQGQRQQKPGVTSMSTRKGTLTASPQRVAGQTGARDKLEQRSAQDQREVVRVR